LLFSRFIIEFNVVVLLVVDDVRQQQDTCGDSSISKYVKSETPVIQDENGTEISHTGPSFSTFNPIEFGFSDKFQFGSKYETLTLKSKQKQFRHFPTVFYF
jgi:hypothetical protein